MRSAATIILAVVAALSAGCGGPRPPAGAARTSELPAADSLRDSVRLTPYERCALQAYQGRSGPGYGCMTRCLSRGAGRDIGGGCWHICYAYTGDRMVLPRELDRCRTLPDTLVPDSERGP